MPSCGSQCPGQRRHPRVQGCEQPGAQRRHDRSRIPSRRPTSGRMMRRASSRGRSAGRGEFRPGRRRRDLRPVERCLDRRPAASNLYRDLDHYGTVTRERPDRQYGEPAIEHAVDPNPANDSGAARLTRVRDGRGADEDAEHPTVMAGTLPDLDHRRANNGPSPAAM